MLQTFYVFLPALFCRRPNLLKKLKKLVLDNFSAPHVSMRRVLKVHTAQLVSVFKKLVSFLVPAARVAMAINLNVSVSLAYVNVQTIGLKVGDFTFVSYPKLV